MKIHPMTAEFIHADGQTDGQAYRQTNRNDEANSCFSQFSNALINAKTRVVSTQQAVYHKPCPSTIPGKISSVLFNPPWLSEFAETVYVVVLRNAVEGDHIFTEA
jgi:hypothetical protein